MLFSVIAAKDGDTYHDEVEAVNQEEAERLARDQLAEAWNMMDTLTEALEAGDPTIFDAELDGFSVDPDEQANEVVRLRGMLERAGKVISAYRNGTKGRDSGSILCWMDGEVKQILTEIEVERGEPYPSAWR